MSSTPLLDKTGAAVDWRDVLGMDWVDDFTVDDPETGDPVDITGHTIAAKIGTAPHAGGTIKATFTATVTNGPAGQFRLKIARTDQAGITPGTYYWACAVLDGDGVRVRWMYGRFTVVDGVAL